MITLSATLACLAIANQAGVFRGARISSLPANAYSTKDNIPFLLLYSRGKWPINSGERKCWQAKHDSQARDSVKTWPRTWPNSYLFLSFLSFAKAVCSARRILKSDWVNLTFAALSLTFIRGHEGFSKFHADRVIIGLPCGQGQLSRIWKVQRDWLSVGKECCSRLSRRLWGETKCELP